MYTAFRLWEASLIFPRKLVKPPVYKGFSICYNFCTFPPPAFGNTDVCIPQGFLLLKGLFSPANTTHPHQPEPKPWQFLRRGNGVGTVLLLGCCKSLLTHFSIPQRLHCPHALPTLKSDKSSKNTIWPCQGMQTHYWHLIASRTEAWPVALAYQISPSTCHQHTPTLQPPFCILPILTPHLCKYCFLHLGCISPLCLENSYFYFKTLDAIPLQNLPWLPQAESGGPSLVRL